MRAHTFNVIATCRVLYTHQLSWQQYEVSKSPITGEESEVREVKQYIRQPGSGRTGSGNSAVWLQSVCAHDCNVKQTNTIHNLSHLLLAQMVKNLPAMQGTQVRSLGWKDPLEKKMSTHSSILAWRIPWTEEPGRLQSTGLQTVGHDWMTNTYRHIYITENMAKLRSGSKGFSEEMMLELR